MFRAVALLFSGGLIGKLLALVRELLLAYLFATSIPVGAYRIAQTATLIPAQFFTSDALNAGFIPLFARYAREDADRAQVFFWLLHGLLLLISLAVSVGLYFGAGWWVGVLAPGFGAEAGAMAAAFTRVMALGLPFYIVGAMLAFLGMAHGAFTLASLRASVQSVGLIAGTAAAFWLAQPVYLAWGFTGAYVVFAAWGLVSLGWKGRLYWPKAWPRHVVRSVMLGFWQTVRPLLLMPFILQGNIAVERVVASLMGVGVVAALDYARFITESGIFLLAVPFGIAGLSLLSRYSPETGQEQLRRMVAVLVVLTVPLSAFLAANSHLVIRVLYQRGAFDAHSVALTEPILLGLSFGFWAHVGGYVMIKALNAQFRNREVVLYMSASLVLNTAANLALYRFLGPLALGIGSSLYGLALLTLTSRALRLGTFVLRYLFWLAPGVVAYEALAWLAGRAVPFGVAGVVVAVVVFAVYWAAFVAAAPPLREGAVSLWKLATRKAT